MSGQPDQFNHVVLRTAAIRVDCRWLRAAVSPVDCARRGDDQSSKPKGLRAARDRYVRRSSDALRSPFAGTECERRSGLSLASRKCSARVPSRFGGLASTNSRFVGSDDIARSLRALWTPLSWSERPRGNPTLGNTSNCGVSTHKLKLPKCRPKCRPGNPKRRTNNRREQ